MGGTVLGRQESRLGALDDVGAWMASRQLQTRSQTAPRNWAGRPRAQSGSSTNASRIRPRENRAGDSGSRITYEPQSAEERARFLRQRAAFEAERRAEARRDAWFAIPALAPFAAVAALEAPALIGGLRAWLTRPPVVRPVPGLRPTAPAKPEAAPKLTDAEKSAIRSAGRKRYAQAAGQEARDFEAQVHHRIELQFQHLMPRADPNRLANLIALRRAAHDIASREWAAFARSLNGRSPTQSELIAQAMKVDRMIQPYIVRAPVPRPGPPLPQRPTSAPSQ